MSGDGSLSLSIAKAVLTVTAANQDINHGDTITALTDKITGFVDGDGAGVVSGSPGLSAPSNAPNAAGVYPITVGLGSLTAANYSFQLVNGNLTVHPKVTDVRVEWGSKSMSILGLARDLPFIDITAIDVVFSDDVTVAKADLAMTGVKVPSYAFSGFSYNASKDEATWTLPAAIGIDRLNLAVSGVTLSGTSPVISAPVFQAGITVLPGDVDGDGAVSAADAVQVRNLANGGIYAWWGDIDGDGIVDLASDFAQVRKRIGTSHA